MFYGIFSPILIVFCICPELHELGDIVEEGEDHDDADVAPPLTHTTLVLIAIKILPSFSANKCYKIHFYFYQLSFCLYKICGQTRSNNLIPYPALTGQQESTHP